MLRAEQDLQVDEIVRTLVASLGVETRTGAAAVLARRRRRPIGARPDHCGGTVAADGQRVVVGRRYPVASTSARKAPIASRTRRRVAGSLIRSE